MDSVERCKGSAAFHCKKERGRETFYNYFRTSALTIKRGVVVVERVHCADHSDTATAERDDAKHDGTLRGPLLAALTRGPLAEEEEVREVGRHPLSHNERMAHRQTTGYTHDKTTNCW